MGVLVVLALLASACTGDDEDADESLSGTEVQPCPELVTIDCQEQVATATIPLAGTGLSLRYASDHTPGRRVAPRWDARRVQLAGWMLDVQDFYDPANGLLFNGSGAIHGVEAIEAAEGELLVPSAAGGAVDVFDADGHHRRTIDALTGTVLYRFEDDDEGRLVGVFDRHGRHTTIERADTGVPTAVVSANGLRTELSVGEDGFLLATVDPIGSGRRLAYADGGGGLLTSISDETGQTSTFSYDDDGRLTERTDADGVATTMSGSTDGATRTIVETTTGGDTTTWSYETDDDGTRHHSVTDAGGHRIEEVITDEQRSLTLADGTSVVSAVRGDPRWSGEVPQVTGVTLTTPKGGTTSVDVTSEVQLSEADDPLSASMITERAVAGDSVTTRQWDAIARTLTATVGDDETTVVRLDEDGDVVELTRPGQATERRTFDDRGRLTASELADRRTTISYTDDGTAVVTDPLGAIYRYTADAAGRPSAVVRPDGRRATIERDPSGRPIAVRVDAEQVQTLGWTPAGRPALRGPGGAGATAEQVTTDEDGRPAVVSGGDGRSATFGYVDGAVATVELAGGDLVFERDETSGYVTASSSPSGVDLTTTFDGPYLVSESVEGPFAGTVDLDYDYHQRVAGITIGETTVDYAYDESGRIIDAGSLHLDRDPSSGLLAASDAGAVRTTRTHDELGTVVAQTVTSPAGPAFAVEHERDAAGRITRSVERTPEGTRELTYAYDTAGRLVTAGGDDAAWRFAYDAHDNRTAVTHPDGRSLEATYDGQDRLVRLGDTTYTWRDDGSLATTTGTAGETTVEIDELGQLTTVGLPDGTDVQYAVDTQGRRVGRLVDGELVEGYLYGNDDRPVARVDADGDVDQRYVYAGPSSAPALIVTDEAAYRVISDLDGSPRRVIDIETGQVVQEIDRNPYGVVTRDTNPGFQPFGFAGGLVDPVTGWVHLGARDYDPVAGRFLSRDPAFLYGGQLNPYSYAGNDPVNFQDSTGRKPTPVDDDGSISNLASDLVQLALEATSLELSTGGYAGGGVAGAWYSGAGLVLNVRDLYKDARDVFGGTASGFKSVKWFATLAATVAELAEIGAASEFVALAGLAAVAEAFAIVALFLAVLLVLSAVKDASGHSGGDPHLTTIDGFRYDFQGAGEYVAVTSDEGDLEVQVRQQAPPGLPDVTYNTAVAADLGGDRVTVDAAQTIRVDGVALDLPAGTFDLPGGGRIVRVADGRLVLEHPDGETAVMVKPQGESIDIGVAVSPDRAGHVRGLLGNADGDPDNDLQSRDGRAVEATRGDYTVPLYAVFGDSWRVTADESLFDYEPGEDTSTFTIREFPTEAATVDSLGDDARRQAEAMCRGGGVVTPPFLDDCILDVGLTGDARFTSSAVDAQTIASRASTPAPERPTAEGAEVEIGDTLEGTIDEADGVDRYHLAGEAGEVMLLVPDGDPPCTAVALAVFDPDGDQVGGGDCQGLRVELPTDGEYEIEIRVPGTGPYRIDLKAAPEPEVFEIEVGDDVSGELTEAGQRHEYRLDADQGDAFYLGGESETCDITVEVFDADDGPVAHGGACNTIGRVVVAQAGDLRIVVAAPLTLRGSYRLSLQPSSPDERFDIAVGDEVSPGEPGPGAGEIDRPGARDVFIVNADPGEELIVRGRPGACELSVRPFDSQGDSLQGLGFVCSDLPFTAPADGHVEIVVAPIDDTIGEYSFRLEAA